jgi:microcystin-dependent protein
MAEPFLSEIRIMGFNFPPKGWALCNGQFLPINQNQPLFSLLGTTFGGNGQTTFALPDLRNKVPIHVGQGFTLGQAGGQQSHTLTMSEMPAHTHFLNGTTLTSNVAAPSGAIFADVVGQIYSGATSNLTTLAPASVTNVGGSQAHENMMPYLVLSFCIALIGIFPSPN